MRLNISFVQVLASGSYKLAFLDPFGRYLLLLMTKIYSVLDFTLEDQGPQN